MAGVPKTGVKNPLLAEAIERFNNIEHIRKLVDRYDTDQSRLIASGSYGDVYDAHIRDGPDGAIGTHIALKVISIRALDSKIREMVSVLREIAVLRDIKSFVPVGDRHRLVGMYEVRRTRDHLLIAMKRCSSHDLFYCITDKRLVMSEANIAWIVRELCLALVSLHSAGCIHRDIKPENILTVAIEPPAAAAAAAAAAVSTSTSPAGPALARTLTSSPVDPGFQVLLGDFGYAHRSKLFKTDIYQGRFLGTAQYSAPEVLLEGRHSAAADVWSLGNVMFALCVGDVPFHGRSRTQVLQSMSAAGNKTALTGTHWDKMSPACKDLVSRMLQFDPASRITADEAARHPFLQGSAMATPGAHVDELQARLRRFNASRRWRRAALACVAGSQLARIRAAAVRAASDGKIEPRSKDSLSYTEASGEQTASRVVTRRSSSQSVIASSKAVAGSLPEASSTASAHSLVDDSDVIDSDVTAPKIRFPRHQALANAFAIECRRLRTGTLPTDASAAAARPSLTTSADPGSRAHSFEASDSSATVVVNLASESSGSSSHFIQEQLHLTRAQFITFLNSSLLASVALSTDHDSSSSSSAATAAAAASSSSASKHKQVNELAASRLFDAFDADGDEQVDLREFCAGIAQVQGDRQTALEMLLSFTDRDANETISATELSLLVRAQATTDEALERTKATMLEEVFRRVDRDDSGELRIRDLEHAILDDPELARLLLQSKMAVTLSKPAESAGGGGASTAETAPGSKRLRPTTEAAEAAPKRASEASNVAKARVCTVM